MAYYVSNPFVKRQKRSIGNPEEKSNFVVDVKIGDTKKKITKISGLEMLLANIKIYDKSQAEKDLEKRMKYSKKLSKEKDFSVGKISKTVDKKHYEIMTKSMEKKVSKSFFDIKKSEKEKQKKRDLMFGFKAPLMKRSSIEVKELNIDEFGRPSYKESHKSSSPLKTAVAGGQISAFSFAEGFERPSINSKLSPHFREVTFENHKNFEFQNAFDNTKMNSLSRISKLEESKNQDEASSFKFDGKKESKFAKRKNIHFTLGNKRRSLLGNRSSKLGALMLSTKPIKLLETTEGELYTLCYRLCQILEQCKLNQVQYTRLTSIFEEIEGEEETELRKVFSNYSSMPKYDPFEIYRIIRVGWIRPLYLGYKLSFILPENDPVLEIQNRRTFMAKLKTLKEKLTTLNFERRKDNVVKYKDLINSEIVKLHNPLPFIVTNTQSLKQELQRERIKPFDITDIRDSFNVSLKRNKSVMKLVTDIEDKGCHMTLPHIDQDAIDQNNMVHEVKNKIVFK